MNTTNTQPLATAEIIKAKIVDYGALWCDSCGDHVTSAVETVIEDHLHGGGRTGLHICGNCIAGIAATRVPLFPMDWTERAAALRVRAAGLIGAADGIEHAENAAARRAVARSHEARAAENPDSPASRAIAAASEATRRMAAEQA